MPSRPTPAPVWCENKIQDTEGAELRGGLAELKGIYHVHHNHEAPASGRFNQKRISYETTDIKPPCNAPLRAGEREDD